MQDQSPVAMKTLIALLAVIFTPIAAISTFALITALQAKETAITARPFPYTSLDAQRDKDDILKRIIDLKADIRRDCELNLGRVNQRIDSLSHEVEKCVHTHKSYRDKS